MIPALLLTFLIYGLLIVIGVILSVYGGKLFAKRLPVIRKGSRFSYPYGASNVTKTEKTRVTSYISPTTRRIYTRTSKRTFNPKTGMNSPRRSSSPSTFSGGKRRRFSGTVEDLNWGPRSQKIDHQRTPKGRGRSFNCPYCGGDVVKRECVKCGRTYAPGDYWV